MSVAATIVCIAAILWLFALDREPEVRTSPALWIATAWMLIDSSRPVSDWLHSEAIRPLWMQYSEGSPLDAAIFGALILGGIAVLNFRTRRAGELLRRNLPMVLFFLYCGLSILWSDYPFIALKRWSKAAGDVVMVLVVLTDADPLGAIKRFFKRVTFILLPVSVLLILFYPGIGSAYNADGRTTMFVGVTTFKNLLGMTSMVCGLSSLWMFLGAYEERAAAGRGKHLLAHGLMVMTALWLLVKCNSMTSLSCFGLAAAVLAMAGRPWTLRKPGRIHLLTGVAIALPLFALFIDSGLLHALGRKPNLTDRTSIWSAVLAMQTNPFVGTGFESFWLGNHLQRVWDLSVHGIQEAHNGYLEVYINLGWIGVLLLMAMIVFAYPTMPATLRRLPQWGGMRLAFFVAGLIYSLTEAGFRMMNPVWIAFLLAIASPAPVFERKLSAQSALPAPMLRGAAGRVRILQ